jgi:hypothetical protein
MTSPGHVEIHKEALADPRRTALDAVLNSATFSRSEQLRSFLRYVGELEICGRASEISEYAIGVNALSRPSQFSPSEDSTVRTRAHLLRQKLIEVYDRESLDSELRVELPKGSYVPRFVKMGSPGLIEAPRSVPALNPKPYPNWKLVLIAAGSLLFGVCATLGITAMLRPTPATLDPVIRQAWGPLVEPNASVLLCVSNPAQLAIRPVESGVVPSWYVPFPESSELRTRFGRVHPRWKNADLYLEFTETATRFGEAFGMAKASRVLGAAGVQAEVLTTRSIRLPLFVGRNLILFGTPEFSGVARNILERALFTIAYNEKIHDLSVIENSVVGGAPGREFVPTRTEKGSVEVAYGLLTVLPSEDSAGGHHRTVIISGTSSAGSHGAMEFFASTSNLKELLEKFQSEGQPAFPPAYQVVVRCASTNDNLLSYKYAAHRMLDPLALHH